MRPVPLTTIVGTGVVLGVLALSGCATRPTPAEKAERAGRDAVAAAYRPSGEKPALPPLTPDTAPADFLRFALLNNPAVEAAYYDWFGAVEKITPARSLPDPKLTFQADIMSIITSLMPGLMVDLPGPGKLAAGAAMATAESETRYFAFEKAVLETAFALKKATYESAFIERKLALNRQTLSLLGDIEKLAQTRNASGQGTLQDVLRAQIEQERLRSEIANLEDSRQPLMERFKAALGLGPDQPTSPLPKTAFPSLPLDANADALLTEALAHNPGLQAMAAEIRLADAGIAMARKARIPDFSVGLEADVKMVPFLWRPQASMTLPIWKDKIAAEIAAAQAARSAAQARLSAEQIALAVEFAEKRYMVRESGRNLALIQERLLPRARQALDITKSAYLTGTVDFLGLLDAERMLLDLQLSDAEAQLQRDAALAEISLVIVGRQPAGAPVRKSALPTPAK